MIYPLLDGTTRRKRGELGHVHLPQSSTPDPSSVPVLKRVGNPHETEVLPGDAHPRNLKPSPGAPGQITASRRFPVQPELLERKGSRPTALFGICYFILCLLGRCDCSFWLACGNENQAEGTAVPMPQGLMCEKPWGTKGRARYGQPELHQFLALVSLVEHQVMQRKKK